MGKIAAYFRTSLEDFNKRTGVMDTSISIKNQRNLVRAFIRSQEDLATMEVAEYYDDGYTGTNFDRPQFQKMIEAAKLGEVTCIVVKDLSRFGRDYIEVGEYIERTLPARRIRLIAVTDGFDSNDFVGRTGGIDTALRNLIYGMYSKDLSDKVRSAMFVKMERGGYVSCAPFGYRLDPQEKHVLKLDPPAAAIVREIFQLAIAKKKTTEIAKTLNERGVPTPMLYKGVKSKKHSERRQMWTHIIVLNILQNIKYTGTLVNHTRESRHIRDRNLRRVPPEEWIVTKGAHEPIVTEDEFAQANANIRKPKKGNKSGGGAIDRVFYCAHCGRKLRKTKGSDTYFSCDTPMYFENAPCSGIRWSRTDLENTLLPIYKAQMELMGKKAKKLRLQQERTDQVDPKSFTRQLENLERSIAACENEKLRKYESYREGHITREQFIAEKNSLAQRKARLEGEHQRIEAEYTRFRETKKQSSGRCDELDDYLSVLSSSPEEMKNAMYQSIERVIVYDNTHIEVRWAFENLFTDSGTPESRAV